MSNLSIHPHVTSLTLINRFQSDLALGMLSGSLTHTLHKS